MIRDNGCGIPEDKLAKIFNPFYTTKKTGTGLGMGIAKKVIDAHSGKIEVNSSPATGTEFRMSIPLADAARARINRMTGRQSHQPVNQTQARIQSHRASRSRSARRTVRTNRRHATAARELGNVNEGAPADRR